ncbi:triacylglycerol lipase, partial [Nocardia sp. NPDC057030]
MWIRKQAGRIAGLVLAAASAAVLQAPVAVAVPPIPAFAGANDWSCRPSAERPQPVVLVHGSGTDAPNSFALLAPLLRGEGHCVFAADLGPTPGVRDVVSGQAGSASMGIGPVGAAMLGRTIYGVADIDRMAAELTEVVQAVR